MASTLSVWVIFAVSFVACAYTLGRVFISANDFAFLNQAPARSAPKPAKQPEPAMTQAAAESASEVAEPAAEHGAEDAAAAGQQEEEEEDGEAVPEEEFRNSRVSVMEFLEGPVSGLAKEEFKLDSFNKFGCHLFLAGAAEGCARAGKLSHVQFGKLLEKCVAVLGSKPDLAKTFSQRHDEYLLEPKYAEMFRAGGGAMEAFQSGSGEDVSDALSRSLENWNKPAAEAGSGNELVAVMFIDLVGSTAMTQIHGDEGAQAIICTHNQIVREALRRFDGSEVKHTGDGIMARFPTPPMRLRADSPCRERSPSTTRPIPTFR